VRFLQQEGAVMNDDPITIFRRLAVKQHVLLGGLTGDVYGAIIEITEVVALLLFVAIRF